MGLTGKYPDFLKLRGNGYAIRSMGQHYVMVRKTRTRPFQLCYTYETTLTLYFSPFLCPSLPPFLSPSSLSLPPSFPLSLLLISSSLLSSLPPPYLFLPPSLPPPPSFTPLQGLSGRPDEPSTCAVQYLKNISELFQLYYHSPSAVWKVSNACCITVYLSRLSVHCQSTSVNCQSASVDCQSTSVHCQ